MATILSLKVFHTFWCLLNYINFYKIAIRFTNLSLDKENKTDENVENPWGENEVKFLVFLSEFMAKISSRSLISTDQSHHQRRGRRGHARGAEQSRCNRLSNQVPSRTRETANRKAARSATSTSPGRRSRRSCCQGREEDQEDRQVFLTKKRRSEDEGF